MATDSGWLLVETTRSPFTKGYVPAGYLSSPIDESTSQSNDMASRSPEKIQASSSQAQSPARTIERVTISRAADHSINSPRNDVTLPLPLQSTRSPNKFGSRSLVEFRYGQMQFGEQKVSEEELQRMLKRNDEWYTQFRDLRNRKEQQTRSALDVLKKSLVQAREKSQDLASQLNRIQTDLEHKRKKWEKKLEERERSTVASSYN